MWRLAGPRRPASTSEREKEFRIPELILALKYRVRDEAGRLYRAEVWGEAGDDGRWSGWLEFRANRGHHLKTPPETVQPNRTDLQYWASGLGAIYLEGAFQRAQMATP